MENQTTNQQRLCNGGCGKDLTKEPLVDKCYDCCVKGKDLTPLTYKKNLSFTPKTADQVKYQ